MEKEQLQQMATEMRNLQTNIHDGEYEISAVLECLYDWELRLSRSANMMLCVTPESEPVPGTLDD